MEVVARTALSARAIQDFDLVKDAVKGDQKAYADLDDSLPAFHLQPHVQDGQRPRRRQRPHDQAFGKAFVKLPSYVPRYAFSTWLFKIAINNCIDYIRKKRPHVMSIDDPVEP